MSSWRVTRVFLGSAISVLEARRFVTAFLPTWPDLDDAVLIVSELATNAVRHTNSGRPGGRFIVSLEVIGSTLGVAVQDEGGPRSPRLLPLSPTEMGGRGLALVSDLSAKWGVVGDENGRTVWAVLEAAPLAIVRS
ncbi:ATP-binding protein [Nonomuraea dietziae]|uniref:ATP-binding protein n=1 Tax=Nonomuraea dietziae TaxID=65515 RepID=UPI0033E1B1BC